MTQLVDRNGKASEINLSLDDYKAAYAEGLSLPQYLNLKYADDTDSDKYGTPFEQALASNGLFLHSDKQTGIRPPTIKAVLDGTVGINMGPITRPDGSQATTLAGRLLFPAVIEQMIASQLEDDTTSYEGAFNTMVASTFNSTSPRVDQPIINLTAPRAYRSQPIAQMSEPPAMASISLSEKSFRLPTLSIGIEISAEAQQASTLDLVGIALREQANAERVAIIDEAIVNMVNGDVDLGMSALSGENADEYDTSISANGVITNKAWIKWLRKDWKKMTITHIICDLDAYLALESRTGRPVVADASSEAFLTSTPSLMLPGIPNAVRVFPVESELLGANTIIGIDSSKAIRRVIYTGAQYSAIEEFVLRKSTAMRFDFSLNYFRLIDQAWKKLLLINS
jgi:hypothetical protein